MRTRLAAGLGVLIIGMLLVACTGAPTTVPNVVDRDPVEATRVLKAAGFKVDQHRCGLQPGPGATPFVGAVSAGDRLLYKFDGSPFSKPAQPDMTAPRGSTIRINVGQHIGKRSSSCITYGDGSSNAWGPGLFLVLWLGQITLAFVAAWDMSRRGERGWLWWFAIMSLSFIGIIIWLVVRNQKPILPEPVEAHFTEQRVWGPPRDPYDR